MMIEISAQLFRSSAARTVPAVSTRYPSSSRMSQRFARVSSSSSMTRINGDGKVAIESSSYPDEYGCARALSRKRLLNFAQLLQRGQQARHIKRFVANP